MKQKTKSGSSQVDIKEKSIAIVSDRGELDLAKKKLSELLFHKGAAPLSGDSQEGSGAIADIVISDAKLDQTGSDLYIHSLFNGRFILLDASKEADEMVIAETEFTPDTIGEEAAQNFYKNIKKRYTEKFDHAYPIEDFVLIVLDPEHDQDGRNREFSNNDMIAETLKYQEFREVIIWGENGQHIDWQYRDSLSALNEVDRVSFSTGKIDRLLDEAFLVVSQSSDVGIRALLHKTHVIFFDDYPYHHMMRGPKRDGRLAKSFNRINRDLQRQEKYLHWLLKSQFVDLEAGNALRRLEKQLKSFGYKFGK